MKTNPLVSRLALALALSLSAASLVAVAGDAVGTTEIEVINNGVSEKISLADLKKGETRQLYSEAGTLVTATRLQDSLQLDIAGEKTTIPMMEPGNLSEQELLALIEKDGAKVDGKHVIRIHRADAAKGEDGHRKIVVLDGKEGGLRELHGDEPHVIVKHGGEGKQVIVKRHVTKAPDADQK